MSAIWALPCFSVEPYKRKQNNAPNNWKKRACVSLFLGLQYDGNRRRPHGARSFAKGKFQSLILWNKTGRIRQCNSKFSTAVFVNLVPRAFPLKDTHFGGESPGDEVESL